MKLKENYSFPNGFDRTHQVTEFLAEKYYEHHKDRNPNKRVDKYVVIGDRVEEVKTVIVHTFEVLDTEDPDLFVVQPLIEWEQSNQGQWIMRNAVDVPMWHRIADITSYQYKYRITAKLTGPALTEWLLRKSK